MGNPRSGDPHPALVEPEPKLANAGSVSKSHDSSKTPIDRIAPPVAVAPFDETKAKEFQQAWAKHLGVPVEMVDSIGMKLVLIPAGEFLMGSPDSEKDRGSHEDPQHRVRITKPFYMGVYPVTQEEYGQVMGSNPS